MPNWIILLVVVLLPLAGVVNTLRHIGKPLGNKAAFYGLTVAVDVLFLAICFGLKPAMFCPLDFAVIGRGFVISADIVYTLLPAVAVPLVLSFTRWSAHYPKDIAAARELMGLPVNFLPGNRKELLLFALFIIVSVVFEELLCRQLWFYAFHETLYLGGDTLVVVTALLFGVFHLYQGWKGILSAFVAGLVLGKIFMITGTITYPIIFHLLFNLTVVVLAWRRIRDLELAGIEM